MRRRFISIYCAFSSALALANCKSRNAETRYEAPQPTATSAGGATVTAAPASSANRLRRDAAGCFLSLPDPPCGAGEHCKARGSWQIDCPAALLNPGETAAPAERPRGKADWLRVRPWL